MIYFFLSWGNWIGLWRQGKAFLLSFYSAVTPLKPSSLQFFLFHEEKGKVVMPHRKSHQLPFEEAGNERAIKRSQMSRVNPVSSQLMGPSMPFISIRWPLMKAFFVNVPTKNSRLWIARCRLNRFVTFRQLPNLKWCDLWRLLLINRIAPNSTLFDVLQVILHSLLVIS